MVGTKDVMKVDIVKYSVHHYVVHCVLDLLVKQPLSHLDHQIVVGFVTKEVMVDHGVVVATMVVVVAVAVVDVMVITITNVNFMEVEDIVTTVVTMVGIITHNLMVGMIVQIMHNLMIVW